MKTLVVALLLFCPVVGWGGDVTKQDEKPPVWNKKMCPNGVSNMLKMTTTNPYDNKGRCYQFAGKPVQLLSQHTAFFSFLDGREPFAFVDLGKTSVPMDFLSAIVIGKGAYSYQTVNAGMNTIHSFVVVTKSKEREVWDNSEQKKVDLLQAEIEKKRLADLALWEAGASQRREDAAKLEEFNKAEKLKEAPEKLKEAAALEEYNKAERLKGEAERLNKATGPLDIGL